MNQIIKWVREWFQSDQDEDIIYDYLEKMESGRQLTEEERQKVLNSAIRLTKEQQQKIRDE